MSTFFIEKNPKTVLVDYRDVSKADWFYFNNSENKVTETETTKAEDLPPLPPKPKQFLVSHSFFLSLLHSLGVFSYTVVNT
jgi:hypothetical protein